MSNIAIIKIHPGLNMALPQLSGDLERAGHESRMYFFKDYAVEDQYYSSSFERGADGEFDVVHTEFDEEYEMLAKELEAFGPDAIGLSVISLSIAEAIKTTQFLRSRFDVPILWGGVGVTLEPEIAIRSADLVCVGEGEEVLVEVADCLAEGRDWRQIPGTWVKSSEGEVIKHPKREIGSLDDIAIPNWDSSKMAFFVHGRNKAGEVTLKVNKNARALERVTDGDYQIMTQRGCPFSCSFCVESRYQEMFGKKKSLRRRSVDVVIEELVRAKEEIDPFVIWFWDDVFTLNPRWLAEFLPKYKEHVDIPFWCYTYPTTHDLGLLKDVHAAGCNCMSMGIQSGSERVLKEVYNRPTPLKRVIEAAQEIVDANIVGYFDLISQSSFETEEDLRSTFEFLVDLPQEMNYIGIGEMKSYPTYAYTRAEEEAQVTNIASSTTAPSQSLYDYYHKLYWVARNPFISREEKLEIGNERALYGRADLLEPFIYGERTVLTAVREMRHATKTGKQPDELFPKGVYVPHSLEAARTTA